MNASRLSIVLPCAFLCLGLFAGESRAESAGVQLKVTASHPLLAAGRKQLAYLKVSLTGKAVAGKQRAAANVAIVLDRSGSMSGRKLQRAKEAAIAAIDHLGGDDVVSVVAYDDTIQVLVGATRVRDRAGIYRKIRAIRSGGSTALFAGVSRGSSEVRKFISQDQVNRVILLSDGLANVGPSSPTALSELGKALVEEGISVSTIGLGTGYNEDLMVGLARASDGNHAFVESASQLPRIFDAEFGDILSVVARDVTVEITCPEGVRPVRVLGREADIAGDTVTARMSQVVARHEKFLLLEVEMPPRPTGSRQNMALVKVRYHDLLAESSSLLQDKVEVGYSHDANKVERMADRDVLVAAVEMIAVDNNKRATRLRDQGKVEEARKVLLGNRSYLENNATRYKSKRLKDYSRTNFDDAQNLAPKRWNKRRKMMREQQMMLESQRSY